MPTSHNVSSSSLNKTDDIVTAMDFDGKGGSHLHFDTLSVKSAALTPLEANLNVSRESKKHGLAPELSRSTPSVNTQGTKTQPFKPEAPKHSAQEQKTDGESSWPQMTPRSFRKLTAVKTGIKLITMLQGSAKEQSA